MDKKESVLEKELKKLEKIGVREISKATHIQEEHIESILNQNYENLLDCNANGFVKILERDYGVDLSEWLEEFNKIKSETKTTKTTIDRQVAMPNLQNHKKTNWKIWILLILLLVLAVIYFKFYDLIKKPINEFLNEKKVEYSNNPIINQAEETLNKVGIEVPKFDENNSLLVPSKLFVGIDENDSNISTPNALDLSIQMQNEANSTDENITKNEANLTLPAQITITPNYQLWLGTIDLKTGKKWDTVASDKITLDLDKDMLVMAGHGFFDMDIGDEKQQIREKSVMRILIKDKNITFIDSAEFTRLNGGKGW
ncbi:MAG: hypothetical protein IKH66_05410 [Campylobacter sp.]|nr:hypothetical protein [Campylobacter sp.]